MHAPICSRFRIPVLGVCLVLALAGCKSKPAQSEALSEAEQVFFKNKGLKLSSLAQRTIFRNVRPAIEDSGIAGALHYCNHRAYPLIDSTAEQYGANIRRASYRYRNPADKPRDFEAGVLKQFQRDYDSLRRFEQIPAPVVKPYGKDSVAYFRPIVLQQELCLNCHGTPGKELKKSDLKVIRKLYPEGKAINHKMGDLRGMWSIRFPRDAYAPADSTAEVVSALK